MLNPISIMADRLGDYLSELYLQYFSHRRPEYATYMGGAARLVDICKFVWENHEGQLRASGDLFYTWQYDVRWAGTALRHEGLLKDSKLSDRGVWELTSPNS